MDMYSDVVSETGQQMVALIEKYQVCPSFGFYGSMMISPQKIGEGEIAQILAQIKTRLEVYSLISLILYFQITIPVDGGSC